MYMSGNGYFFRGTEPAIANNMVDRARIPLSPPAYHLHPFASHWTSGGFEHSPIAVHGFAVVMVSMVTAVWRCRLWLWSRTAVISGSPSWSVPWSLTLGNPWCVERPQALPTPILFFEFDLSLFVGMPVYSIIPGNKKLTWYTAKFCFNPLTCSNIYIEYMIIFGGRSVEIWSQEIYPSHDQIISIFDFIWICAIGT